ncbi:hypothetical protein GQ600_19208 [Phytophthora cactorum]|nr:hypothetical protein GQ600_19208 [Phytophthora cactorum]
MAPALVSQRPGTPSSKTSLALRLLKLAILPMLNPIENVFSAYKSAVKRFLARPAILRVPEDTTISEHRARYLEHAADPLFAEVVTPDLCNRAFCHSLHHHQRALRFEDMEVGIVDFVNNTVQRCSNFNSWSTYEVESASLNFVRQVVERKRCYNAIASLHFQYGNIYDTVHNFVQVIWLPPKDVFRRVKLQVYSEY